MAANRNARSRLLVKVSTLYYIEGLSQQEIAERLAVSRPHVSRLLTAARSSGMVDIRIRSPFPDLSELERELERLFGLHQAVVAGVASDDAAETTAQVAQAAADWLTETLGDGQTICVMSGTTLSAVARALDRPPPRRLTVVPAIGGQGPEGAAWQANETARVVASRFGGRHFLLNAPAVVAHPASRAAFLAEPGIRQVLELAAASDVALLGIGAAAPDSTTARAGGFSAAEVDELVRQGAVGNIGSGFFTVVGEMLDTPLDERFIGLTLAQLKAIPRRIGVAWGTGKAAAIAGALCGQFLTALVTDEATARAIIRLARKGGRRSG